MFTLLMAPNLEHILPHSSQASMNKAVSFKRSNSDLPYERTTFDDELLSRNDISTKTYIVVLGGEDRSVSLMVACIVSMWCMCLCNAFKAALKKLLNKHYKLVNHPFLATCLLVSCTGRASARGPGRPAAHGPGRAGPE